MKRYISLLLVLAFVFFGCGSSKPSPDSDNTSGGSWGVGTYVDEFKQPTGKYVTEDELFSGTFSNSAVTEKKLVGYILVDKNKASVKLYEYGSYEVKNPYRYDILYNIIILDEAGEKHYFYGGMRSKGDRIIFLDDDYEYEMTELIDLFNTGEKLSFYIEESDGMSKYYFTVDFAGFKDAYNEIVEQ